MTTAYNGRIFAAAVGEGKPFQIVWDGQIYENESYVVPKGAPNKDLAMDFIRYATSTEGLRAQASHISYGPPRKSANLDRSSTPATARPRWARTCRPTRRTWATRC